MIVKLASSNTKLGSGCGEVSLEGQGMLGKTPTLIINDNDLLLCRSGHD